MTDAEREEHFRRFIREAAVKYSGRERCACGHAREDHADTHSVGHGRCLRGDPLGLMVDEDGMPDDECDCERFTWASSDSRVYAEAKRRVEGLDEAQAALAVADEVESDFED